MGQYTFLRPVGLLDCSYSRNEARLFMLCCVWKLLYWLESPGDGQDVYRFQELLWELKDIPEVVVPLKIALLEACLVIVKSETKCSCVVLSKNYRSNWQHAMPVKALTTTVGSWSTRIRTIGHCKGLLSHNKGTSGAFGSNWPSPYWLACPWEYLQEVKPWLWEPL